MEFNGEAKEILNLILRANPSIKIKPFHQFSSGSSLMLIHESAIYKTTVLYVVQWPGDYDWFGQEGEAQDKVAEKMVKRLLEVRKKFGLQIPEFRTYKELKMKYMLSGFEE